MAASTANRLRSAGGLISKIRLSTYSATGVRFAATKSTSTRIQGETIGFDEHDTIKQSGTLAQGDLKSKPGESARQAAEEKVGRGSSTKPTDKAGAKENSSEQERVNTREELAAEAGI